MCPHSSSAGRSATRSSSSRCRRSSHDRFFGVRPGVLTTACALLATLACTHPADAQCATQKLVAADGSAGDNFGVSIAIQANAAIVAAYHDDDLGLNSGSAYIFEDAGAGFIQRQKLLPASGGSGDLFGVAVDLSGTSVVVGAVFDDDRGSDAGAAYVFEKQGGSWTETGKLLASDGAPGDQLGFFVGISGTTAIATANLDDDLGTDSGSATVFTKTGGAWVQTQKLLAPGGAAGDQFGYSVAIDGTTAVLSSPFSDDRGADSGSLTVFELQAGTWVETQHLVASDGSTGDALGLSVEIDGDTLIAGAPGEDTLGSDAGAAYVFERVAGVWTETAKLLPKNAKAGDGLGGVSVSGAIAVVGASKHDFLGPDSGAVYVFRKQGSAWVETDELEACDGRAGDRFGWQVRIDGTRLLTGAQKDDDWGTDSGSAYVYDLAGTGCGQAKVGTRNAAPNLDVLRASDPLLGSVLDLTVDTQGFAFATVLAVALPAMRRLDNGFWAFIRIDSPITFRAGFLPGPIATVRFPIPADPSLCGLQTFVEAKLHNAGPGPFALTNSQDLTLGW